MLKLRFIEKLFVFVSLTGLYDKVRQASIYAPQALTLRDADNKPVFAIQTANQPASSLSANGLIIGKEEIFAHKFDKKTTTANVQEQFGLPMLYVNKVVAQIDAALANVQGSLDGLIQVEPENEDDTTVAPAEEAR